MFSIVPIVELDPADSPPANRRRSIRAARALAIATLLAAPVTFAVPLNVTRSASTNAAPVSTNHLVENGCLESHNSFGSADAMGCLDLPTANGRVGVHALANTHPNGGKSGQAGGQTLFQFDVRLQTLQAPPQSLFAIPVHFEYSGQVDLSATGNATAGASARFDAGILYAGPAIGDPVLRFEEQVIASTSLDRPNGSFSGSGTGWLRVHNVITPRFDVLLAASTSGFGVADPRNPGATQGKAFAEALFTLDSAVAGFDLTPYYKLDYGFDFAQDAGGGGHSVPAPSNLGLASVGLMGLLRARQRSRTKSD